MNERIRSTTTKKLKVCLVTESYPPEISGVSSYVSTLSQELVKGGYPVTVITLRHGANPRYETQPDGVKVYRLRGIFQNIAFIYRNPSTRHHPPVSDWWLTRQIARVLAAEKPDIVHCQGRIFYSVIPLRRQFKIPVINTLHGYDLFCPTTLLLNKNAVCQKYLGRHCVSCGRSLYGLPKSMGCYWGLSLNRDKLKGADTIVAVSQSLKESYCRALKLPPAAIKIIPDFSLNSTHEGPDAMTLPPDFILYAGFLWPYKGVDVLIQAYQKLSTATSLVLIGGSHPDYTYENHPNVVVIRNARHDQVLAAMKKCRCLVVPSVLPEPFGIVAIEAMSQKKAVIASDTGGLKDIVTDRVTGILTPPGDARKLGEAMDYLLKNPEIADKMGACGFEKYQQNYTAARVVPRIIDEYHRLTGRR